MLLVFAAALADTFTDDFSTDAGAWSGGSVRDGVLALSAGTATLTAVDLAPSTSFALTARVRMTGAGGWSLAAGGEPLVARYDVASSGLAFGDTEWPLPMGHLSWVPDADPVFEATGDSWEAGGVLHATVLRDPDTGEWLLYYTAFYAPPNYGYRMIGLATSSDGRAWSRAPGNPVLSIDYSDDVDGVHVHMPDVLVAPSGVWHMTYACYQNNVGNRLCHATSADGRSWTPQGVMLDRGAVGTFDSGSLRMPAFWVDDAGLWHLWYDGTDPEQHYGPTGYATSPDGWVWSKVGEILDADHALQGLDVVESPWGLESFHNKDDYFRRAHADPADPGTWTDEGTVLTKGWSWWNDGYIQAPTVALDGTTWRMWFNGYTYTDGMERLGHATAQAAPGGWLEVTLTWDGATLRAAVDGAELGALAAPAGPLTLTTDGSAELDDLALTWSAPTGDTGDTGDDTGDTDTGGTDTGDTDTAAADSDTAPTDTGDTSTPGCGCGTGSPAGALGAAAALALLGARRRARA